MTTLYSVISMLVLAVAIYVRLTAKALYVVDAVLVSRLELENQRVLRLHFAYVDPTTCSSEDILESGTRIGTSLTLLCHTLSLESIPRLFAA